MINDFTSKNATFKRENVIDAPSREKFMETSLPERLPRADMVLIIPFERAVKF